MSRVAGSRAQSSSWRLRPTRTPTARPAAAAAALWLLLAGPAAATGGSDAASETIPGGDFSDLRPDWRQIRPDEGLKLAVTPPGWHVDDLGGPRIFPHPGVDPASGDPCIVFLYGAGRMDLFTEPFLLDGPGRYSLSLRTRSVVAPGERLLRAQLRLLPDGPPGRRQERVVERWFGTAPEERIWSIQQAGIEIPPGYSRAEIHLIKEVEAADFLVDDVSLRRTGEGGAPAGDPYRGLQAYGGDPDVRTELALYQVLAPEAPRISGTPEGAFASARENGLDWAAVASVSSHLDDPRGRKWREERGLWLELPGGGRTTSEWEHVRAVARHENEPGTFVAFAGLIFDGGGHADKGGSGRKLILLPGDDVPGYCSPRVDNAGDCPVVRDAYRFTRHYGGVMMALAPCEAAGGGTTDWSLHDPLVSLMAIHGGLCETGPGGLVDVNVRRGLLVGAGGGSGSLSGQAGLHDRTICWAAELTRRGILEAIRQRRCYWSAAGHLEIRFQVNGAAMGAEVPAGGETRWELSATSRDALGLWKAEILRDGEVADSVTCSDPEHCYLRGGIEGPAPGIYYAAIDGPDGLRVAVTSPVRVAAEGRP